MKKDKNILSQEMVGYCESAIEESRKLCDDILDNYNGKSEQKEILKEISRMIEIDNLIKQKISQLSFSDITIDNSILDEVDVLLKQKFNILDILVYTDEKELV
jgi:polyhydroxyalkanoate synthesis regulator phasin